MNPAPRGEGPNARSFWSSGFSYLEEELRRRSNLLARLRLLYNRSHQVPLRRSEPLPKDWAEAQLDALGEYWRQREYWQ